MGDTPREHGRDLPDLIDYIKSMRPVKDSMINQLQNDALALFQEVKEVFVTHEKTIAVSTQQDRVVLGPEDEKIEAEEAAVLGRLGLAKNLPEWDRLPQKDRRLCRIACVVALFLRQYATSWFEHRCFEGTRASQEQQGVYEARMSQLQHSLTHYRDSKLEGIILVCISPGI